MKPRLHSAGGAFAPSPSPHTGAGVVRGWRGAACPRGVSLPAYPRVARTLGWRVEYLSALSLRPGLSEGCKPSVTLVEWLRHSCLPACGVSASGDGLVEWLRRYGLAGCVCLAGVSVWGTCGGGVRKRVVKALPCGLKALPLHRFMRRGRLGFDSGMMSCVSTQRVDDRSL